MLRGVKVPLQRQLYDGDIGVRIDQLEGNKNAMVKAARRILTRRQASRPQKASDFFRQRRRSRRRILQRISFRRKTVIVVDQRWRRVGRDRKGVFFPVRRRGE